MTFAFYLVIQVLNIFLFFMRRTTANIAAILILSKHKHKPNWQSDYKLLYLLRLIDNSM